MTDQAKKKAGPADSLSNAEKQANKRRTSKVRRQQQDDQLRLHMGFDWRLEEQQWADGPYGRIT